MTTATRSNVSPYAFAKELGVRPQMVYNYISKGWIKAETNELGKKFITPDEQERVIAKRAEKAAEKKAQIDTELGEVHEALEALENA